MKPRVPRIQRSPGYVRIAGVLRIYQNKKTGKWHAQSWPKGNGGDTPKRKAARETFTQVVKLIKNAMPEDRAAAEAACVGTPLYARDILMKAAMGTLIEATDKTGFTWRGVRDVWREIQQFLNVIGQVQGSILYRNADGWVALEPVEAGYVLESGGPGHDVSWQKAAGGGYDPGSPPSIAQFGYTASGGNSVTLGTAPADGSLLVAMVANPTSQTAGSGWTKVLTNTGGTDYGIILTKVCGASETALQTPMSGVSTTGAICMWEFPAAGGVTPFVTLSASQTEQTGIAANVPVLLPNEVNCTGVSMVSVVSPQTITSVVGAGVQDVLDNSHTRNIVAGHTDLSKTPMVGIAVQTSANASTKSITAVISS